MAQVLLSVLCIKGYLNDTFHFIYLKYVMISPPELSFPAILEAVGASVNVRRK